MARSYARIITAIWRNKEFRQLRGAAQRVYLLLVTQPDISAVGTLPLTVRRWADLDADTTSQEIVRALEELEAGRFVTIDRTTEELLVRSFVKWDGGYNNRKRIQVIRAAGLAITSQLLRQVLALECDRLGFSIDGLVDAPEESASEPTESTKPQVNRLSDRPSDVAPDSESDAVSRFDRVVVGYVSTDQPTTHNPQPVPTPSGAGAQQIVGTWIEGCQKRPPKQVIGIISKNVKALLEEGVDPTDVQEGLQRWADKGSLHPSTLPTVVNEVMNRPRAPARASTTDQRVAQAQALKAEYANVHQLPGAAS